MNVEKDGYSHNEKTAHKFFRDLGFKVSIPRKGERRGYDFLISLKYEGETFTKTVEVKGHKSEALISYQLDVLRQDGLVVISHNGEIKQIFTKDDILETSERKQTPQFNIKWKGL